MGYTPISALPAASSVSPTDEIPVVHAGSTVSATPQKIADAIERRGTLVGIAADGSVNGGVFTIDFTPAFSSVVGVATLTIANYTGPDTDIITYRVKGTPQLNSMQISVLGGSSGNTLDVHWRLTGN